MVFGNHVGTHRELIHLQTLLFFFKRLAVREVGGKGWTWSLVPWRLEGRKEADIYHSAGDTKNQGRLLLDNDAFPPFIRRLTWDWGVVRWS